MLRHGQKPVAFSLLSKETKMHQGSASQPFHTSPPSVSNHLTQAQGQEKGCNCSQLFRDPWEAPFPCPELGSGLFCSIRMKYHFSPAQGRSAEKSSLAKRADTN